MGIWDTLNEGWGQGRYMGQGPDLAVAKLFWGEEADKPWVPEMEALKKKLSGLLTKFIY